MEEEDIHLLHLWLRERDQSAFATLMRRYGGLVFGTALRRLGGNRLLAEEAAQNVFVLMAAKAESLARHPSLGAWLHRAAMWQASTLKRDENTHSRKLNEFAAIIEEKTGLAHDGSQVLSELDAALARLGGADRRILFMRYFEQHNYREIARRTGLSEAAAQKQSSRALHRLTALLHRRGVTASVAAISTTLPAIFTQQVPAAMAEKFTSAATAAALSKTTVLLQTLSFVAYGKKSILTAAAVILLFAVAAGSFILGRQQELRRKPEAIKAAAVPRPTARGQGPIITQPAKPAEPWPEFGTPEFKKMALERGNKWLESRGRDAASLVAAWDITGEEALLLEAAEKFPGDPRVCLAMIQHAGYDAEAALPWIERLIASEPDNPGAHYLKVSALMKQKDRPAALAALRMAVALKGPNNDHLGARILTVREAALASGASIREAAQVALAGPLSHTTAYQTFTGAIQVLREEIAAAKAAGDQDRLVKLAGLGMATVAHTAGGSSKSLIDEHIGMAVEKAVLLELEGDTEFGATGRTVAQQLEDLDQRHIRLSEFLKQTMASDSIFNDASDAQIAEYTDRFLLQGERAARVWLHEQIPKAK